MFIVTIYGIAKFTVLLILVIFILLIIIAFLED